ncbi:type VII secretion target [Nocardia stercoris]|uniref:Uncharacterized protein n=1 Tax=Nocardia stercoris TaxID=2483361 RepID=A0A3M2KV70_9NOCA|nr:type VII secretion target [Nocardia stercoris]RMI29527.1 hypothetical protein EBN03_26010 [Nocardia stercoris]
MADGLNLDPAELRRRALDHQRMSEQTREWSKPPSAWLDAFQHNYGTIAEPVRAALNNYYDARERAGNHLADQHAQTSAALHSAADDLEGVDLQGGSTVSGSGGQVPDGPTHAGPGGPGDPVPAGGPTTGDPVDAGHTDTRLVNATTGAAPTLSTPMLPDFGSMGGHGGDGGSGGALPGGDGFTATGALHGTPNPDDALLGLPGAGGDLSSAGQHNGQRSDDQPPMLVPPMLSPFARAVAAAKDSATETAVVNGGPDDDLILARTLLGAVLAAVDSPAVGLAWAVSVMRGPSGVRVFLTSTEGRGWLPAGLFLPQEVSTPWQWDELLGGDAGAAWEGITDPARILAEFGAALGPRDDTRITALVSSAPIDAGLKVSLPDASVEGMVGPAYDLDLRVSTPDTLDRLGLTGTAQALESVAAVQEPAIRLGCLTLAADAHAAVGRTVPTPAEALSARNLRERILTTLQAGQSVPRQLWDDLRDADDLLSAAMLSRRVDVGRVELGGLRLDDNADVLRAMVFERRCTELVLLLSGETDQQTLRDAVYAHQQIAAHPQFVPPVARPAATAPAAGPVVTAGPPSVAVAPPVDAPPVVAPLSN